MLSVINNILSILQIVVEALDSPSHAPIISPLYPVRSSEQWGQWE